MFKKWISPLCISLAMASSAALQGAECSQPAAENPLPWYFNLNTGYAWSMKANIDKPRAPWDYSKEGYNNRIGNSYFWGIGIGKAVTDWLDIDAEWTNYNTFHYQKEQSGSSNTVGYTGNRRVRYFDLNNNGFLANARFHLPRDWEWDMGCMTLGPFVGAGIGCGINSMSHFYTVGHDHGSGIGSTTSIGEPTGHIDFAWQANVGLSLRPKNGKASYNFAYRYYDGGKFQGPNKVIDNTSDGHGEYISVNPWEGRVKTNQFLFYITVEM